MTNVPLVSVAINNFNYGRFVGDAIESALTQTYGRVEVIVVDDGSADESRQTIESFGRRITAVFKDNGGQASAYNAAFPLLHGESVCFLDADDIILPAALATAVPFMADAGTVKVQWPLYIVDRTGARTGGLSTRQQPPEGDLLDRILDEGPLYDFEYTTGNLYRRAFLDAIFPVPEPPYRNGADMYLATLAPAFGTLRTAREPLGTYRAHGTNNYRERPLDDARIANYMGRFDQNSRVLADALRARGFSVDPARWRTRNFNYLWLERLQQAKADLARLAPAGARIVVVGGHEWGPGDHVPGRTLVPFTESEGDYNGPPADDAAAVAELGRQAALGARFVAVWWTVMRWLDEYPALPRWLDTHARRVAAGEALHVYELT